MPESLATALLDRFAPARGELAATFSLTWMANAHSTVRRVLGSLASLSGPDCESLVFREELVETGKEGRPDSVGRLGGRRLVVLEGKYWADLTKAQPCGYLDDADDSAAVVFLCPSSRVRGLSRELGIRVRGKDQGSGHFHTDGNGTLVTTTSRGQTLMVLSWPDLIERLRRATPDKQWTLRLHIGELENLVHRAESNLVQWSAADLTQGTPLFSQAVATARLAFEILTEPEFLAQGVIAASNAGWGTESGEYYRRKFKLHQMTFSVGYAGDYWTTGSPSPLSFTIYPQADGQLPSEVYRAYRSVMETLWSPEDRELPHCSPVVEQSQYWWGLLPLAAGASVHATRQHLKATLGQVLEILGRSLKSTDPQTTGATTGMDR